MQNKAHAGRLVGTLTSLLEPESTPVATAQFFDQQLELGHQFRALTNLILEFERLLTGEFITSTPDEQSAFTNLSTLRQIVDGAIEGRPSGWQPVSRTTRQDNPLGGFFNQYPLPALFLQPPSKRSKLDSLSGQVDGIKRACLYVLACGGGISRVHADSLRQLIAKSSVYEGIWSDLPVYTTFYGFWQETKAWIGSGSFRATNGPARQILQALARLVDTSPPRWRREVSSSVSGPPPRLIAMTGSFSADAIPLASGTIWEFVQATADRTTGEPPLRSLAYISEPNPDDLEDIEEDDLDAAFDQSLDVDAGERASRYWIGSLEQVVPGDARRLTSLERGHLAAFLNAGLVDKDPGRQAAAAILALMYVTGQHLDDVIRFSVGRACDIDHDGVYHKAVNMPADGYQPDEKLQAILEPRSTSLALQLPHVVSRWLSDYRGSSNQLLLSLLGVERAEARRLVKTALEEVRDRGRYRRIRQERIPTALSMELALKTRSPLVQYLLAGRSGHAPPTAAYYMAPEAKALANIFAVVTDELMAAP